MRLPIILLLPLAAISIHYGYNATETPEGWASLNGGTTGGIGGEQVTVSTFEGLKREAESAGKKIIFVEKGDYRGVLSPQSDKSILGLEPGVLLDGNLIISGVRNVIIRNIAVTTGEKCTSFGACQSGSDAVNIGNGAENVWFDHVDISDGQDGNCDLVKAADFITMTWCKFWYSYDKEHAFSNLIASSNGESESEGKLNITFAYTWWADRVQERQPWGRFGKIHILNNLFTSQRTEYASAPGHMMQQLVEYNVYNCSGDGVRDKGGEHKCIGNIGTNPNITCDDDGVFTPPYTLSLTMEAAEVEATVRAGAGNTLTLGQAVSNLPVGKNSKRPYLAGPYPRRIGLGQVASNPSQTLATINGRTLRITNGGEAGQSLAFPPSEWALYLKGVESRGPAAVVLPVFP